MKKVLSIALLALLPSLLAAQDHLLRPDTAAMLVDRYLRILNADGLPADSTLELVTTVTTSGNTDTFTIRRWYAAPQMHRVEVWHGRQLQTAFCSNGKDRYRLYKPDLGYWVDITPDAFYDRLSGYDFRGPLHGWRAQNAHLTYKGAVNVSGKGTLHSVFAEMPGHYSRYYLFEPTGLLAVIIETGEMDTTEFKPFEASRIEWKCMHEYQQVGPSIVPKQESFMRRGQLTVMETTARLVRRETLVFNQDNLPKQ